MAFDTSGPSHLAELPALTPEAHPGGSPAVNGCFFLSLFWSFFSSFPPNLKCCYSPCLPHIGSFLCVLKPLVYSIFALPSFLNYILISIFRPLCMSILQASQTNRIHTEFIVFPTPVSPWEFCLKGNDFASFLSFAIIQLSPKWVLPPLPLNSS